MQPLENCIGPTIRIGREILCLPYAGFYHHKWCFQGHSKEEGLPGGPSGGPRGARGPARTAGGPLGGEEKILKILNCAGDETQIDTISVSKSASFEFRNAEARLDRLEGAFLLDSNEEDVFWLFDEEVGIDSKVHRTLRDHVAFWEHTGASHFALSVIRNGYIPDLTEDIDHSISNRTFWRFSCIIAMVPRNSPTVEI